MSNMKFLVYDKAKGFSRLIKQYFSDKVEVKIFKGDDSDIYELNTLNVAFIQINSMDDLVPGMVLAHYSKYVFWSSSYKDVRKILNDKEGFIFLDMHLSRKEILMTINNHIEMIKEE